MMSISSSISASSFLMSRTTQPSIWRRSSSRLKAAKAFFAALGHTPATELFKAAGVATDENGYIIVENNTSLTNIPGVFAAGDCMDPRYRQASVAAGNGVKAALDAEKYLADYAAKQQ